MEGQKPTVHTEVLLSMAHQVAKSLDKGGALIRLSDHVSARCSGALCS